MCRWLAYSGTPVLLEELLYKPAHSLIDQSLHSRLGATTTNGDGFGVGWYGVGDDAGRLPRHRAGLERPQPPRARGPRLLRPRLRAHPRLDRDGDPGDELPSVPPRPLAVDAQRRDPGVPARQAGARASPSTRRSTRRSRARPTPSSSSTSRSRSGSRTTRRSAVARAVGLIEATGRAHGVEHPIQMTVATTDGDSVWAFRYSSEGSSRIALLQHLGAHAEGAVPRQPRPPRALGRVAADRARSRSATSRAPGTRCRSRAGASSRRATTSCTRSRPCLRHSTAGLDRDASGRSSAAPSRKQIAPRNVPAFASVTSSSSPVSGTT